MKELKELDKEEFMATATWIIALATLAYTAGTFLLWHSNKHAFKQSEKASKLSEDAFRLNTVVNLIGIHRPIYGTAGDIFGADEKIYENLRCAMNTVFAELIKKEFPVEGTKLLDILNERYGA